MFGLIKKGLIFLLIFHDNFVAEGIFVNIFFLQRKLFKCDVIIVILKSAEAIGYNIFVAWQIMKLRSEFFYEKSPTHNSCRIVSFIR